MEIETLDSKVCYEDYHVHRDVSWLSFNARVLQEAMDKRNPVLERVKFLGIYSKNLGEFFHVRMPYHLNLIRINKSTRKRLSYSPKKLVKKLINIVNEQQIEFTRILRTEIIPELESHNIFFRDLEGITDIQRQFIHEYFTNTVRLHVDPLLMRGKSISPFLKDGSLYLGILISTKNNLSERLNDEYGLVRIPSDILPRFVVLPSERDRNEMIILDDIVRYGLPILFSGFNVGAAYSFKMTRDAELYIDNKVSGELKEAIKKSLHKRQTGVPARFVYDRNMSSDLLAYLSNTFDLKKYDKIKEGRYQNYHDLLKLPNFDKNELLDKPLVKLCYPSLESSIDPLEKINERDHIIHPPYHSFESVIRFFEYSSVDKTVEEILLTQYRIGDNSRILNALIYASQNGKKVTVFLEIQARFDEKSNLAWGEKLERAGIKVIYSIPGIKVHCKIGLVKRRVNEKIETFSLLSTGNFHEDNSKIYSDLCLFTSDSRLCTEVESVFDYIVTRTNSPASFSHLLVGKVNLREELVELIDEEIANAIKFNNGYIILKMNSLEDPAIIEKLYKASKANVKVDLIIRGICCLIPGIPNVSENIRVVSILDRYLEHARIYYFHANGDQHLYLSSADFMTRNLSRRVEVGFPIYDVKIKKTILKILNLQLSDNYKSRHIDAENRNTYVVNNQTTIQSQTSIHSLFANENLVGASKPATY